MENTRHHIHLPLSTGILLPAPTGETEDAAFEVIAINAGSGNGWNFSPDALEKSLPLWDGVETFIDHAVNGQLPNRSIRDLAGICCQPVYDPSVEGIRLKLRVCGPSGNLLTQLGREWLVSGEPRPRIGFSADLCFTARGRDVETITVVHSLDLVFSPARGGAFIQPIENQSGGKITMQEPNSSDASGTEIEAVLQQPHPAGTEPGSNLLELNAYRLQLCQMLLENGLQAAHLPAPLQEHIRRQLGGRVFEQAELTNAIEDARRLQTEILGGAIVEGPARISGMVDSRDQLQAAADDLLGAPRQAGMENLKAARLSGIRELYLTLTGDDDLHGGYYPGRVRLSTTADFTGLVKNSLNKVIAQRWDELGRAGYDWWQRIATVEHFSTLNQITGTLVGTVGSLPEVAEGGDYTELVVGDSPETADWKKFGGYIPLTLELIDRDETRKLRAYPRELASAGLRKISALVAEIFTANSGIGPNMADGGALFNATAVTTAGGHKNLLTTALSAAEWDAVCTAVYNQPLLVKNASGVYGTGPKMAVNPRFCLVPRTLQLTAMKVLYPMLENTVNIVSENMQRGQPGDVLTVPEWTDANNWAAVCDPRIAPAVFIGERFGLMPEIFIAGDEHSSAVFTNDEHRLKVRHFLAAWVNDFRPLHKSNVA